LLLDFLYLPEHLRLLDNEKGVVVVRIYADRCCFANLWYVGYLGERRRLRVEVARMVLAAQGGAIYA
jgi:hypothetical protein